MPKITVENFDEVKLHLRRELGIISSRLEKSIGALKTDGLSASDILKLQSLQEVIQEMLMVFDHLSKGMNLSPNIEVKIERVETPEIKIPDITIPEINVPQPIINFQPPEIKNDISIDIDRLLYALEPLKYISDRANKPISVRMSDGQKFIKAITELKKSADEMRRSSDALGVVYAGSSGLTTDDLRAVGMAVTGTVGDGSKTVTTAGTRVQLVSSSVNCRKVKVIALAANTGTIWVGGSTVASGRGEPLVAQQSTDWIETNNVSNVWIDSTVNAEGVSYIYV